MRSNMRAMPSGSSPAWASVFKPMRSASCSRERLKRSPLSWISACVPAAAAMPASPPPAAAMAMDANMPASIHGVMLRCASMPRA